MLSTIVNKKTPEDTPEETPEPTEKIRSIRFDMNAYKILEADSKRCKRSVNGQLDAIIAAYYGLESVELDYDRLEEARRKLDSNANKFDDRQASEKKRKTNSHLGIATAKTTQEEWRELCKLSGEKVPIDALVMYHEYHDKGDRRFLTDYTARQQQLVTAYKEGRIKEFLSNIVPEEKTAG
jgi:hypothetical protein